VAHELLLARLRVDAWLASTGRGRRVPRILVSACETFPIYSQTFVHQEVVRLRRHIDADGGHIYIG
jgi:hypothetical protein